MKAEDYPLEERFGMRLRRCPELPNAVDSMRIGGDGCTCCVARTEQALCLQLRNVIEDPCNMGPDWPSTAVDEDGDPVIAPCVFVEERKFEEYVVEWVRRRIS